MVTREILLSHPIAYLRSEIRKTNIQGFLSMKKDKLVDAMMERKVMFGHIVASGRKGRGSYQGKKQRRALTKKETDEMKKTKKGRLALIERRIDDLPERASPGRMEALKAQLRAERANKSGNAQKKATRKPFGHVL